MNQSAMSECDAAREAAEMRSAPQPACALCGGSGEALYAGQRDRLFGAGGKWNLKRCVNPDCGVVWLDPMPLREDLWKAYLSYYTHAPRPDGRQAGAVKRLYLRMKHGYWAGRYGYQAESQGLLNRVLGRLLYLFPVKRASVDEEVRYLSRVPGGRLLDVGCGTGEWLALMRGFGWQVQGNDFDASAVEVARGMGLDVVCGALEAQEFPDNRFDAITLNHVIEHVPDPMETLRECARILKPGGKVLLFTPNAASFGHSMFKQDWRGLEVPRHLQVLTPRALEGALRNAGLREVSSRTLNSSYVLDQSIRLRRAGAGTVSQQETRKKRSAAGRMLAAWEQVLLKVNSGVGECILAIGTK
jgi:2-polyprenyl-3-methyl-5-hydroxy-6-metoxy-1,4-benzoquinol methylase